MLMATVLNFNEIEEGDLIKVANKTLEFVGLDVEAGKMKVCKEGSEKVLTINIPKGAILPEEEEEKEAPKPKRAKAKKAKPAPAPEPEEEEDDEPEVLGDYENLTIGKKTFDTAKEYIAYACTLRKNHKKGNAEIIKLYGLPNSATISVVRKKLLQEGKIPEYGNAPRQAAAKTPVKKAPTAKPSSPATSATSPSSDFSSGISTAKDDAIAELAGQLGHAAGFLRELQLTTGVISKEGEKWVSGYEKLVAKHS